MRHRIHNFISQTSTTLLSHVFLKAKQKPPFKLTQAPPFLTHSTKRFPQMEPNGTIVFTTVGRPYYGFDLFSVKLPSDFLAGPPITPSDESQLTDGVSVNFNGQFVDDDKTFVYISERTGSARMYMGRTGITKAQPVGASLGSLFFDRPFINDGVLYFISAHEPPENLFKSWSALYSTRLDSNQKTERLTPYGSADFSPAVSRTGKFIAVASYGSRSWAGDFRDLKTDVVVFPVAEPEKRVVVATHGGWPTWSGDDVIYFHRQADDGWWSIFKLDFQPQELTEAEASLRAPVRVTPPGVHCFTPAAFHNSAKVAVATRRKGKNYRHIEVFDLETREFIPITEVINSKFHHYNPFISPDSSSLGYHRFRGESAQGESIIPHLDSVASPVQCLRLVRLNGSFPAFSPSGAFIALNHDFDTNGGLKIVKSDGSKRWTLLKDRVAFYNSWSPVGGGVIFTSIGPIFQSAKATVQIARITFDQLKLTEDVDEVPVDVKILTKEETGNNAFPSCSPDGKSIVFRSGRSGHKNLYIVDAVNGEFDGGSIRQLTEGPWIDTMPSWSPDGKLIAFSSNMHNPDNVEAFGIYVIKPDGTGLRRIHVAGGDDANRERLNHVCFSADGEWLLFTANVGAVTAEPVSLPNQFQPYGDLYVVKLDGSGLKRLTWNGYENGTPAWHPTGGDVDLGIGRMRLNDDGEQIGDKLEGQFEEPLWITCDI